MAIHGTRSEIITGAKHSVSSGLLTWMHNASTAGESNKLTSGAATLNLGKSLGALGNPTQARAIPMATLSRQMP